MRWRPSGVMVNHRRVDPRVLVVAPSAAQRAWRLTDAARRRGMVLGTVSTPGRKHYYGGPRFADRVAGSLGVGLLEPADSWLATLPDTFTRRTIRLMTLADAREIGRAFVKPPSGKEFPAQVYDDGTALAAHLPPDTVVQVSDIVEFAAEYRLFVLDGAIHTGTRYMTWGHLDPLPLDQDPDGARVRGFTESMLAEVGDTLPSAVVIDVGLLGPADNPRLHPAVVEANMAWFTQSYQADTDLALEVVLRAAGPADEVSATDHPFLRAGRPPVCRTS
jgi:hypothetical protein